MNTFLLATGLVALTEMGDKTQLLALFLVCRYKKPMSIILGMLAAIVLNHLVAASLGQWLMQFVADVWLRWILGLGFIAMGCWVLISDKLNDTTIRAPERYGVAAASCIAFFLAEMGDKTQVATFALAARFPAELLWVVIGTTLGMMLANVPAVLLGGALAKKFSAQWIQRIAAILFISLGSATLLVGLAPN